MGSRGEFGPVLVGLPGAGKSTVGAQVAVELGLRFIDTDGEIERGAAERLPDLLRRIGSESFRQLERRVAQEALRETGVVVATGGGVVLHSELHSLMRGRHTVWLHAELAVLAVRISRVDHPLLVGQSVLEALQGLWRERQALYEQVSVERFDTGGTEPERVAQAVVQSFLRFRSSSGHS